MKDKNQNIDLSEILILPYYFKSKNVILANRDNFVINLILND